jgi:peptide deformylase
MAERHVLLLGDPRLRGISTPVTRDELPAIRSIVVDLSDTLAACRRRLGIGRGIAAPQIGALKRIVVTNVETLGSVLVNPIGSQQ